MGTEEGCSGRSTTPFVDQPLTESQPRSSCRSGSGTANFHNGHRRRWATWLNFPNPAPLATLAKRYETQRQISRGIFCPSGYRRAKAGLVGLDKTTVTILQDSQHKPSSWPGFTTARSVANVNDRRPRLVAIKKIPNRRAFRRLVSDADFGMFRPMSIYKANRSPRTPAVFDRSLPSRVWLASCHTDQVDETYSLRNYLCKSGPRLKTL